MKSFHVALQRGFSTLIAVTSLASLALAAAGTAGTPAGPASPGAISCKPLPALAEPSVEPMSDGDTLRHFYGFNERMLEVFRNPQQSDEAAALEYLGLAQLRERDWNYGNAVHDANSVLGLLALQLGDIALARDCLRAAGASPGSPQLNSFGPNMQLARALVQVGEFEAVANYLVQVRRFWKSGSGQIDRWLVDLVASRVPDFCGHLRPVRNNPRLLAECGRRLVWEYPQASDSTVPGSGRPRIISRAAELAANPTTEYPYAGFWKRKPDCSDEFGLAIAPAGKQGLYSVSFCGPGGCFEPGTYRPNTGLIDDLAYQVIDTNTIGVGRCDGTGNYRRYVRCPGRAVQE